MLIHFFSSRNFLYYQVYCDSETVEKLLPNLEWISFFPQERASVEFLKLLSIKGEGETIRNGKQGRFSNNAMAYFT